MAVLYVHRGATRRDAEDLTGAAADFSRAAALLVPDGPHDAAVNRPWLRAQASSNAGECLLLLGRHGKAFEAFLEALVEMETWFDAEPEQEAILRESYAWMHAMASESARGFGEPADALQLASEAVEIDPEHASWHVTRGLALQALARHTESVAEFDEAVRLNAELSGVHAHRARSLDALGETAEQLTRARERARKRPDDPDAWLFLGDAARVCGDRSTLTEAFTELVTRFPERTHEARHQAEALADEHAADAVAILDGILAAASPDNPEAPGARQQRGLIRLYDVGDYEGALEDLRHALAGVGEDTERAGAMRLHHSIGETYWSLDQWNDAIGHYQAATRHESDPAMQAELQLRLAECLVHLDRTDEAQPHLHEFWERREAYEEICDPERLEWARQQLESSPSRP